MAQEETGMDQDKLDEVRELVDFLKANGIAEFDMERTDMKVRIKFAGAAGALPAGIDLALAQQLLASGGGSAPSAAAPAAAPSAAPAVEEEKLSEVKSPIVGTF